MDGILNFGALQTGTAKNEALSGLISLRTR